MSQVVEVRGVRIGEGIPKICVPIIGTEKQEIMELARRVKEQSPDLVEWRADWFGEVSNLKQVASLLQELREILQNIPFLFTFRTKGEGGEREISQEMYLQLNQLAIESGVVDFVDVEAFIGKEVVQQVISYAHEKGVKVIASNHDFERTPAKEEILLRLRKMQALHADIAKIAVMPKSKADVMTLLCATSEMQTSNSDTPIVTMSMGKLGAISRMGGEVFGSAITFGTVGKCSAPGQIPTEELREILAQMHKYVE